MPPDEDPLENENTDPVARVARAKKQQADEAAALHDPNNPKAGDDPTSSSTGNSERNGPWANKTSALPNTKTPFSARTFFTKGRGSVLTMLLLLALGGGGIGLFGGAAAPIAFLEPIVQDLNDQLRSLDVRTEASVRNKMPSAQKDKALAGCSVLSIRCKFRTISSAQYEKLSIAGIKVSPEKPNVFGRWNPTDYEFQGNHYNPQDFYDAISSKSAEHSALRGAFKRANNMVFQGFNDKTFVGRVLKKWGLTRETELKGTHQDKVNQLLTHAQTDDVTKLKFTLIDEDDPSKGSKLEGDESDRVYTPDEVESLNKSIESVKTVVKPPSRLAGGAIKGLSVLGAADLLCTVKNMIGAASVAAKVKNKTDIVKAGFPVQSMIGQLKAHELSADDASVLQEYVLATDDRTTVNDVQRSFNSDSPVADAFGVDDQLATIPNPDYGKNALDNTLSQMSNSGGVAPSSPENTHYSLGVGQNMVLAGLAGAAEIAGLIANFGAQNNEVCHVVQNWAVRIGGMIAGLALGIASGGGSIGVQALIFGGIMAASLTLESMLNSALSGNVVPDDIGQAPVERGIIGWTSAAITSSEAAQNRGMMPGNASQIVTYNKESEATKQEYIALDQQDTNPLDVTTPDSFLGSFVTKVASFNTPLTGGSSFLKNTSSLLSGSIASVLQPAKTMAAGDDTARFKQCDDPAYQKLGIDADVQCNIRFVMSDKDLAMDMDDVALYMENNGYVEPDTTTGLPIGYTAPEPEKSQGFAEDMLNGVANTYFDSRAADPNYNDYAKFLDYCAYRAMPWGETYTEGGAIGSVDQDWQTGKKCLDDNPMMSNFRIYTFDKTVQEANDDEPLTEPTVGSQNKALLAQIILKSGRISYLDPRDKTLLENIASGANDGNKFPCGMNINQLHLIADITAEHTLKVNDLNRACKNSDANGKSGPESRHFAGNGSAVDFGLIDGIRPWSAQGFAIMKPYFEKYLVPNSSVGQSACLKVSLKMPVNRLGDDCTHLHLDFPPNSDPYLQCKNPIFWGGCTNAV